MRFDAAVIGCGRMGAFTSEGVRRHAPACWLPLAHAEAIRAHPALHLQALADPQPETLARALAAYGVARGFADGQALLEATKPTLVGIATRTIGRAGLIAAAVAYGARALHVEKPLCNSLQELTALESLFSRDDLFVTYGAIRRHLPPYLQARALVESGALGQLLEVQVNLGHGALFWTHPHSTDLLLFAARGRRVVSVAARLSGLELQTNSSTVQTDPRIEAATVLFDDGVEGRIARTPGCDLVFACERGLVIVENDGHAVVVRQPQGDNPYLVTAALPVPDTGAPGGTGTAVAQLVRCLNGESEAIAANAALRRDILTGQRLLLACVQSHLQGGRIVDPAVIDPSLCVLARSGALHA